MTVEEEFVMALFNPSVVSNASRMFKPNFEYNGHKDRLPIDLYDMNFRLYKPTPDYVNFEFYTSCSIGSFFMPIALIDKELNIFLINEFISTYLDLYKKGSLKIKAKSLSLEFNAIIAAFSATTLELVIEIFNEYKEKGSGFEFVKIGGSQFAKKPNYDKFLIANGYKSELIFSNQNFPQFYLDSEYRTTDPVATYLENSGEISLRPTVKFQDKTNLLTKLSLLTAFDLF